MGEQLSFGVGEKSAYDVLRAAYYCQQLCERRRAGSVGLFGESLKQANVSQVYKTSEYDHTIRIWRDQGSRELVGVSTFKRSACGVWPLRPTESRRDSALVDDETLSSPLWLLHVLFERGTHVSES